MEWFKKHWWMFAIFVVLTVASIVGVIYGVTTHTEAGLQRVCWRSDGRAVYDCPNGSGSDLVWDHVPVVIYAHAGRSAVEEAASLWNGQVGIELFRLTDDQSEADVLIVWGAPIEVGEGGEDTGGFCEHSVIDGRMTATVGIVAVATARLAYLVTVHELGHLIGLAHDDFESSPMFPVTSDDTNEDRMGFTVVTSWDRELLRRTYER